MFVNSKKCSFFSIELRLNWLDSNFKIGQIWIIRHIFSALFDEFHSCCAPSHRNQTKSQLGENLKSNMKNDNILSPPQNRHKTKNGVYLQWSFCLIPVGGSTATMKVIEKSWKMCRIIQICPILKFESSQFSRTSIEKNEHFLLFTNIVYLNEMFRLRDQFSVFEKSSCSVSKWRCLK